MEEVLAASASMQQQRTGGARVEIFSLFPYLAPILGARLAPRAQSSPSPPPPRGTLLPGRVFSSAVKASTMPAGGAGSRRAHPGMCGCSAACQGACHQRSLVGMWALSLSLTPNHLLEPSRGEQGIPWILHLHACWWCLLSKLLQRKLLDPSTPPPPCRRQIEPIGHPYIHPLII